MMGLNGKAVLFGTCGLLLASVAGAAVPVAANSSVPTYISLGGAMLQSNPAPDPSLAFTITVRDDTADAIEGSVVEVEFSNCLNVWLCTAVIAGQTVECASGSQKVIATTNQDGQVTLSILGGSNHSGAVPPAVYPGAAANCISVSANDPADPTNRVVLGAASSVLYDLNGAKPGIGNSGVNGADVGCLINDVGACFSARLCMSRSDYDHDLDVDGADVARYRDVVGKSVSGNGSGAGCFGDGTNGPNSPQPYCP